MLTRISNWNIRAFNALVLALHCIIKNQIKVLAKRRNLLLILDPYLIDLHISPKDELRPKTYYIFMYTVLYSEAEGVYSTKLTLLPTRTSSNYLVSAIANILVIIVPGDDALKSVPITLIEQVERLAL